MPTIAEPSAFFGQNALVALFGGSPIDSVLTRWHCSNLHALSQPSRFAMLPSSHCSRPARTASPHTMFLQLAEQVAVFGGSHCSPPGVSMKPSPHVEPTQS